MLPLMTFDATKPGETDLGTSYENGGRPGKHSYSLCGAVKPTSLYWKHFIAVVDIGRSLVVQAVVADYRVGYP